jgi:hypothetical protein
MKELNDDRIRAQVRNRYAGIARTGGGCRGGDSCCSADPLLNPEAAGQIGYSKEEIAAAPDGANMGLGCGNPRAIAALQPGETVVDLGSGVEKCVRSAVIEAKRRMDS